MEQLVKIKRSKRERAVTLTPNAVNKIRQLLGAEDDPSLALRMAVRAGGCSGFSYEMYFDSEVDSGDTLENFDGVGVVVDNQSVNLLRGSVLDYNDGLMDAGFAINNPNVSRSCGCGNSFS
ncbi:MAG: iron-sulfur cluster assembly accessory protein [bacterium]|nr:iron-sulfur cluster assembly accessory protein [bacterium]